MLKTTQLLAVVAVTLTAALISACARNASVQTPPTPVFAIAVNNATAAELVVSYDDGTGARALGTVLGGRTERFIIAGSTAQTVDVLARTASGGFSYGPYRVVLLAGETVPVTIR